MGAGACREKKRYKWVGDGQRGGGRGHRTGGLGGCSSPWLRPIHRRPQPLSPPSNHLLPPTTTCPSKLAACGARSSYPSGSMAVTERACERSAQAHCQLQLVDVEPFLLRRVLPRRIFAPEQASGRHCPETIVNQPSSRPKQRRRGCGRASCAGGTLPSARCRLWAYS